MKISDFTTFLESFADPSLQEQYDNAGLLTGDAGWDCTGVLVCLDATEEVINEAIKLKFNLVVAHHPIIFGGLKKLNGKNYVEKTVIKAIKNDVAIYAIHTNLDNVAKGVNGKIASLLGLEKTEVLLPKKDALKKLYTFVPLEQAAKVRDALFAAGAGHIGNYSECSFNVEGFGTYKAGESTNPFKGEQGLRHEEKEVKMEMIFPSFLEKKIIRSLLESHPYEEVAYDIVTLANASNNIGAGVIGQLPGSLSEEDFLKKLKEVFRVPVVRHSPLLKKKISKVAVCGGAGSFLVNRALAAGADAFVTGDMKYHEFFDANDRLLIADVGHYESEQFTINLLHEVLLEKFPNFAVRKTGTNTNPVQYF